MQFKLVVVFLFGIGCSGKGADSNYARFVPAYDAVTSGMKCSMQEDQNQISCTYRVGHGLAFEIAGVGRDDAAVLVSHAEGLDSDYYFKFGILHGCIIVASNIEAAAKAGQFSDMAFVSPKSGKVYKTWQSCETGI